MGLAARPAAARRARAPAPARSADGLPLRQRVPRGRRAPAARRSTSRRLGARAERSAPRPAASRRARSSWPTRWRAIGARAEAASRPAGRGHALGPTHAGARRSAAAEGHGGRPRRDGRRRRRVADVPPRQVALRSGVAQAWPAAAAGLGLQSPVLGPERLASTRRAAGSTGMQATGQTCTHCGSSKWPTHSVQLRRIDDVDLRRPSRSPGSGTRARRRRS